MSSLSFVPMREDDLEWVAAREHEIYPFPWSFNNFRDALSAGYSSWLVKRDETAIGYAVLMQVLDEAHILNISIVGACQKLGFGDQLLRYLKDLASSRGAQQMFLEVRVSNSLAFNFYERRGFSQIGRRKGYYPAVEGREDAVVMRCEL